MIRVMDLLVVFFLEWNAFFEGKCVILEAGAC
jgi:hypothetical protein